MDIDRSAAIEALLDKEALRDLATRYSRAIDRRDPELLRSVYHDDAVDDHGVVFCDKATVFIDRQPEVMAQFELTAHYICNSSYRIDQDRADGELYFIAYHRTSGTDAKHIIVSGRYLDNYEKRARQWRISHRRLVWDSFMTLDVSPCDMAQLTALGIAGSAVEDRSYAALPLMGRGK
ncbi:nuclear transport factor 2 family protein [Sphingobium lactosutens]|mgnify:CR=1 FL=1|uniref:nuclear transport factor 2 family protein n=1 Tax=Sphingobium lactosutens TaxID=522773 RepID=UPI0015BAF9E6|nr:nuclear transport factor 2 family protein [Sphingobium lactosutens]NWK98273.1 nuclear transport factor 2 family protein [Sphingobium lactosutens]